MSGEPTPWRDAYLAHSAGCADCLAADSPSGQCDAGRALYEAARVEAGR